MKEGHSGHTHSPNHTPTPSPAHTSLLGIPPLTTPTATHEVDKINQDFDDVLAELLGPDDDENILDVTIPADTVPPKQPTHTESSTLPSLTSPLSKLPPLDKLPPLKPPDLNKEIGSLSLDTVLQTKESPVEDEEIPDYSADFNSESERSRSMQPPAMEDKSLRWEDACSYCWYDYGVLYHCSFAIEELEDDDGSLSLSIEGENFAGDNLLGMSDWLYLYFRNDLVIATAISVAELSMLMCRFNCSGGSSSAEDFRNIVTPPAQAEGYHPILEAMTNGDEDLNKADDNYLAQRKAEMETVFQANQIKPGDKGYVYDKEMAFEGPKMESGWDSDSSISDF